VRVGRDQPSEGIEETAAMLVGVIMVMLVCA
jgi:hypothetical protein